MSAFHGHPAILSRLLALAILPMAFAGTIKAQDKTGSQPQPGTPSRQSGTANQSKPSSPAPLGAAPLGVTPSPLVPAQGKSALPPAPESQAFPFQPGQARGTGIPEEMKNQALRLTIRAVVLGPADTVAWQADSIRETIPGTPVSVKLVGTNVAILVQLTPFDDAKGGLLLVTQGQVWVKRPSGELSYFTSLDTVSISYGERVFFFPLGRTSSGGAPMRVEVSVSRSSDLPLSQETSHP